MKRFLRDNGIGLGFGLAFLVVLVAQSFAGWAAFNQQQISDHLGEIGYFDYLTSASFAVDVSENWQSEYLQFSLYIAALVWLVQRGSPDSKKVEHVGVGSDEDERLGRFAEVDSPGPVHAGGWRLRLYSNSLVLVMGGIFFLSWFVQSVTGNAAFNAEQLASLQRPQSWLEYLASADFWNRTFQNWQSELLAVGSMSVLAIYLRQRGSPESKDVGAPHSETGS
ncbi:DUF6766 family protein [Herbiconiux sp. SYSU D00978]|uniref:DUF6766 family protein n=1 Tax=Herbiconiux sp. SYSU D00978 TaxID=2812562 RepID=UPI001A95BB27|nr:DUF6766 family protein [Herbiconiux sp. SYSU D00978]